MGHKKVPVFFGKTTTVQRKFCVPFPCPFRSTYFRVFFSAWPKLFYARGTVKKNGEKNVVRTYVKQESESCSSVKKNYSSVNTDMVFSDYKKRRILVLRQRGNYPPTTSRLPRSNGIRVSWQSFC